MGVLGCTVIASHPRRDMCPFKTEGPCFIWPLFYFPAHPRVPCSAHPRWGCAQAPPLLVMTSIDTSEPRWTALPDWLG